MTATMKRVHLVIRGTVQGVFYRATARDTARSLGVTGWVRNRPDGSVEAVVEGEANAVEKMIAWCQKGPPMASVSEVEVSWETYRGAFDNFTIRHDDWG